MKTSWNWRKYAWEFVTIFVAVVSAFALNNWNDNRRDEQAATKILTEIANGLEKDLEDIEINVGGHKSGLEACKYWQRILSNKTVDTDSVGQMYFNLMRDFFSAQNSSGYETLKSRGLELIKDDSLRYDIISLYEYDYKSLKTMEEEYHEMQFQKNYFHDFNRIIAPYLEFDSRGNITAIKQPLDLVSAERKVLQTYLWKIGINRMFVLSYYTDMERKINSLSSRIKQAI